MDEEKIEEYLKRQGITSMQETGPKKVVSVRCSLPSASQILNVCDIRLFVPIKSVNQCWLCPCASRSYPFKRGRSKVGRGRDTSRRTTTIWQACWRTIQTASLLRSEVVSTSLLPALTAATSVNLNRPRTETPTGHTTIQRLQQI